MKPKPIKYFIPLTLLLLYVNCSAQPEARTLTYPQFMEKVNAGNLEYSAEKLNVDISDAEAIAANVINDPQLAIDYFNNEQARKKMGYGGSLTLSQTLTFGKRTSAVALAKSKSALSRCLLADYRRNLLADATIAYLDALKKGQLCQVKLNAYKNIDELSKSDSLRFSLGSIMEIDATQSKLEAGIMYNELLQTQADAKDAFSSLSQLMGMPQNLVSYQPDVTFRPTRRHFVLDELMLQGKMNRPDYEVARQNVEVANLELKVVHRQRNADVDVSLGISRNARVENEEAPAPPFTGVSAGIALPIQFSRLNKGEIRAAEQRSRQASIQFDQTLLQMQNEIRQAFNQYESQAKQTEQYENGMLDQANQVLKGKIYSYNRGEVSLLEVLNAQRTYDDIQALYYETLYNYATALVELERSVGIWDFCNVKK